MNSLIGGWWSAGSVFIGGLLFPMIGLWTLIPLIAWAVYLIVCECWLDTTRLNLRNVRDQAETKLVVDIPANWVHGEHRT